MSIGCRSVEYWPSVDMVLVGRVSAKSSVGCRSVEYWRSVDRVLVGRVLAECC